MKCPCEQCISFAICKMELRAFTPNVSSYSEIRNCHDLQNYLGVHDHKMNRRSLYQHQINVARKLYGLVPMRFLGGD